MLDIPDSGDDEHLARLRLHLEAVQRLVDLGSWEAEIPTARLHLSQHARRIFGWADDVEPTYERVLEAVHPDDRHRLIEIHFATLADRPRYSAEHRIIRPDGEVRHVREDAAVERAEDGTPLRLVGVLQDVTEQTRLTRRLIDTESRRRELLHRMVRSSEQERLRIASDLHDGPIQMLTVATMRLEHLRLAEPDPPPWLPDAIATVRETVVQLRDALFELHPSATAHRGLRTTIAELAATIVPEADVVVAVDSGQASDDCPAVFGIVQEALWDIRDIRPSETLDIRVAMHDAGTDLEIAGDPGGSTEGPLVSRAGLFGVRDRCEALGGRCTLDEGGRVLRCHLPPVEPEADVEADGGPAS